MRVPQEAKANLAKAGLGDKWREGLHAAMHAMQNVVPLHMMCGPNDLGAECDNPYSARFRPDRLLLFDKCPGGIGLAYKVPTSYHTHQSDTHATTLPLCDQSDKLGWPFAAYKRTRFFSDRVQSWF